MAPPPVVAQEPAGPAVQAAPPEMPQPTRSTAPILPPLSSPPQPSWKQELRQQEPAAKPETTPEPPEKQ
jgi:hypothetical protein